MEDLPTLEPALTATKAKYLEAINDLSRVVLPSYLEQEYNIHDCKPSEIEALADELGMEATWFSGVCSLDIHTPQYCLRIYGRAFHG